MDPKGNLSGFNTDWGLMQDETKQTFPQWDDKLHVTPQLLRRKLT